MLLESTHCLHAYSTLLLEVWVDAILTLDGCSCFYQILLTKSKLQYRSTECIFLGYCSYQKCYICMDLQTKLVIVSGHGKFIESNFPYKKSPIKENGHSQDVVNFIKLDSELVDSFLLNKILRSLGPSFVNDSGNQEISMNSSANISFSITKLVQESSEEAKQPLTTVNDALTSASYFDNGK